MYESLLIIQQESEVHTNMGKVTYIKSCRKERKCQRCGKVIEKGTPYWKGELNFHPDIVRCEKCGLAGWEVTTSDYQLSVGEVIYRWSDGMKAGELVEYAEDVIDSLVSSLEDIKSDQEDRLNNMPEQLQDSDSGQLIQERIDQLDECISNLQDIDIESLKDRAAEDVMADEGIDYDMSWAEAVEFASKKEVLEKVRILRELNESFEDLITDSIEESFECLEM